MIDQLIAVVFLGIVLFVGLRVILLAMGMRATPQREMKQKLGGWERYDPMNDPIPDAAQKQPICTGLCIAVRGGELTRSEPHVITRERVAEHVYREIPAPQRVEMPIPVEPDSVFAKRDKQRK